MHRFLLLLLCALAALSMGTGAVAHAAERSVCAEQASDKEAEALAAKENKADQIGGVNIQSKDKQVLHALLDMSTTAQINDSLKLGGSLLGEIARVGKLHKPKVEQAAFTVLKAPDIPSILIETAFISNPDEEKRLSDEAYQERLAQAILKGIKRYFSRNPPLSRSTLASNSYR